VDETESVAVGFGDREKCGARRLRQRRADIASLDAEEVVAEITEDCAGGAQRTGLRVVLFESSRRWSIMPDEIGAAPVDIKFKRAVAPGEEETEVGVKDMSCGEGCVRKL
jgi:hypothetical protein